MANKTITDFDVLKEMQAKEQDIRIYTNNFLGGQIKGKGKAKHGILHIGCDEETFQELAHNAVMGNGKKLAIITYIVDEREFFETKAKLQK